MTGLEPFSIQSGSALLFFWWLKRKEAKEKSHALGIFDLLFYSYLSIRLNFPQSY
jgi:hypothetical protein